MVSKKQNTEFGIVLTLALLVIASIWHIQVLYSIAVFTLIITTLIPVLYTPMSWVWFRFSKFIEIFFSTVILIFVFFIVVTPVGILRRWFAKDNLQLQSFKRNNKSVFIEKNATYKKDDLEKQF